MATTATNPRPAEVMPLPGQITDPKELEPGGLVQIAYPFWVAERNGSDDWQVRARPTGDSFSLRDIKVDIAGSDLAPALDQEEIPALDTHETAILIVTQPLGVIAVGKQVLPALRRRAKIGANESAVQLWNPSRGEHYQRAFALERLNVPPSERILGVDPYAYLRTPPEPEAFTV